MLTEKEIHKIETIKESALAIVKMCDEVLPKKKAKRTNARYIAIDAETERRNIRQFGGK